MQDLKIQDLNMTDLDISKLSDKFSTKSVASRHQAPVRRSRSAVSRAVCISLADSRCLRFRAAPKMWILPCQIPGSLTWMAHPSTYGYPIPKTAGLHHYSPSGNSCSCLKMRSTYTSTPPSKLCLPYIISCSRFSCLSQTQPFRCCSLWWRVRHRLLTGQFSRKSQSWRRTRRYKQRQLWNAQVRHFQVLHFQALRLGPSFSGLAFSDPVIWSVILQGLRFHALGLRFGLSFSGPAFSGPANWSVIFQVLHFQVRHFQSPHGGQKVKNGGPENGGPNLGWSQKAENEGPKNGGPNLADNGGPENAGNTEILYWNMSFLSFDPDFAVDLDLWSSRSFVQRIMYECIKHVIPLIEYKN